MRNEKYSMLCKLLIMIALIAVAMISSDKWVTFLVPVVFAHCDTINGPVIQAARKALETGNIDLVLVWVQKKDESEIRKAFEKTLKVRKQSPEAKELADMYFFETLVRIHRAGEGASYDGIKPEGTEVEPGIEAADKAVEAGSVDKLAKDLTGHIDKEVRERFQEVMARKKHKDESVEAGREYVEAYVTFIHYVEGLFKQAEGHGGHHAE